MSARALLTETPRPTVDQIKRALAGNLCRCGAYPRILRAVLRASGQPTRQVMREMPDTLTRRSLLKAGGSLVVSFALDAPVLGGHAPQTPAPTDAGRARDPLDAREVDSVLSIQPDGTVTIYTSKVDVGTGMRIAIAQMAADELGVAVERVTVVDGDTGRCPNHGGTGGSTGLTRGGTAVRQAAATARQALLTLAAKQLEVSATDLRIVSGEVRPAAGGRGIALGRLIGGKRFALQVDRESTADPRDAGTSPSADRRCGPTCRRSAPAATRTSRISPFPACCTRG